MVHKNFTFQVPFTITTLGDSSLMKIEMHLIHNSDFSVVFAFLFTYLCGAISFAILISSLVTRRKSIELYDEFIYRVNLIKKFVQFSAFASTMISSILFLASCAPGIALLYTYSRSRGTKMLACLGLNSGLFFGIQIMLFFIDKGDGIQWSNFASGIDASDPMALIDVMGMFIVDAIVYFILAIYVEGVWPGEFGTPLPWYFPFTVSQSYLATGNIIFWKKNCGNGNRFLSSFHRNGTGLADLVMNSNRVGMLRKNWRVEMINILKQSRLELLVFPFNRCLKDLAKNWL